MNEIKLLHARTQKPQWTCPHYGHQFVTRNIWHSWINYPLEKYFRDTRRFHGKAGISLVKATEKEIKEALSLLAETPGRIAHLTTSIEEARLQERQDKQWSVNEILAHLRSCADVWGDSIAAMLTENFPTLSDLHPRKWIKETNYLELPFQESLQAFISQREGLLITLEKLSFEDWSRAAMIAGRKHTVFTQARRLAKHEKEHCEQIESLLQRVSQR